RGRRTGRVASARGGRGRGRPAPAAGDRVPVAGIPQGAGLPPPARHLRGEAHERFRAKNVPARHGGGRLGGAAFAAVADVVGLAANVGERIIGGIEPVGVRRGQDRDQLVGDGAQRAFAR